MTTTIAQPSPAQTIKALREWRPAPAKVLSVYLDTSAARVAAYAYVTAFRDGRRTVRAGLPTGEQAAFDATADMVDRFLRAKYQAGAPGVAIFASGTDGDVHAVRLPQPPLDTLTWDARPQLDVLEESLDIFGRAAVVLFDKAEARLFTVFLGDIESTEQVVDYLPGKQSSGGWFALSQSRVARHREQHVLRHVEHTLAELRELESTYPFQWLVLGGPDEALSMLRRHLPRTLQARTIGTIAIELAADDAAVLHATSDLLTEHAQRAQREEVEALLSAEPGAEAVLGLHETLAALNDRRVHRLVLADPAEFSGAACVSCGALSEIADRCSVCGSATPPTTNLRSFIVDRVHEQGAGFFVLHGDAAASLLSRGGIGAWVRFELSGRDPLG